MLRTRAASATLIVVGTLIIVALGGWVYALVVLGIALLALQELLVMLARAGHRPTRLLALAGAALLILVALADPDGRWLGAAVALVLVLPLLDVMRRRDLTGALVDWAVSTAAILYIGWLAAHAVLLRFLDGTAALLTTDLPQLLTGAVPLGLRWTLTAILVTWAVDTAAYATGSTWGRRRMAPIISPGKTWEGAAGGLLAGTAAMVACAAVLRLPLHPAGALAAGVLLSVIAQVGDLAESLLKRQTGVKDAGDVIPGHGGVLDRIDSLLFTVPAAYYLALWLLP